MRTIKFRGKRIDNGHWVYGHYFQAPLTDENSGMPSESGWFFLSGNGRFHCIGQDGVSFVIDPKTLGEFTGLKDKNGKEIYEGDIVEADGYRPSKYVIRFIEGGFCADDPAAMPIDINHFYPSMGCQIAVVGNIYENPELLKSHV